MKTSAKIRAFSLVELLVTIAVIMILARILMPMLGKVRQQAHRVTCVSNLRQFGIAIRAYANENKNALPPGSLQHGRDVCNVNNNIFGPTWAGGYGLLIPTGYLPHPRNARSVFFCPAMNNFSSSLYTHSLPPNDYAVGAVWPSGPPSQCDTGGSIKSCTGGYDYRDGLMTSSNNYTYRLLGDTTSLPIMSDGITAAATISGKYPNERPHPHSYRRGFINILYGDGHVISWLEGPFGAADNLWGCEGGTGGSDTEPCFNKMPKG